MSDRKLRILLIGNGAAGFRVLRLLADGPCQLVGILRPDKDDEHGESDWPGVFNVDIPSWAVDAVRRKSFAATVAGCQVDIILNVNSAVVVCPEVLNACRIGAYNLHPGPLPKYSGANAPNWALYNGEKDHAVTLHEMTPHVNAGAIVSEERIRIEETDNGFNLRSKCDQAGTLLVGRFLLEIAQRALHRVSEIPSRPQVPCRKRLCQKSVPNGGRIDWDWLARDVVNHIRACDCFPLPSPWAPPVTSLMGDEFGICKATLTGRTHDGIEVGTVGQKTASGVWVACADEWIEVQKLRVDGLTVDAVDVFGPGDFLCRVPLKNPGPVSSQVSNISDGPATHRLTASSM